MAATPASPVPRTPHHGTSVYSRDGKWIYFIPGPADGPVEAFEMPAAGGEAVQITHGGAFHPEESYGGTSPYYSKGPGRPGVWTMSLKGGPERQVLDSVADQNWTLSPRGIYYLEAPPDPRAPAKVNYYSFQTRKSTSLGTIDRAAVLDFAGISLSPDTRTLLYSQVAGTTSDLMLIENFR